MICPNCRFDTMGMKAINLATVLSYIAVQPYSITELAKITQIPRSSLIYYLTYLEGKGMIKKERKYNLTGRPTICSINSEVTQ